MPILAYLCLFLPIYAYSYPFRLINLFPPPIFLLLPLQACSFFDLPTLWLIPFRNMLSPCSLFLFLSSQFSRFSLIENNRAPSGLRILHSQFSSPTSLPFREGPGLGLSILNSQFSILNSQLVLPSGCNGCSMDDEWVPNGCSLGAPFTVLVRKLFFMFFRRTRI